MHSGEPHENNVCFVNLTLYFYETQILELQLKYVKQHDITK